MPQQSEVLLVVTHPQSIPVQLGLVLSESLLRAVVQLGCSRAQNSLVDEPDMVCDRVAPNVQFVGREIRIGIANGQTAYNRQLGWDIQLSSDNVRITPSCPHCRGRMIIVESFGRSGEPRAPPP